MPARAHSQTSPLLPSFGIVPNMPKSGRKAAATTVPKNTSVALDPRSQAFIRAQLDAGEYASASDVMREALRRFESDKAKEEAFYAALRRGMDSPRAPEGVFERLREKFPRGKATRT